MNQRLIFLPDVGHRRNSRQKIFQHIFTKRPKTAAESWQMKRAKQNWDFCEILPKPFPADSRIYQ
jgi:hypothetical protein